MCAACQAEYDDPGDRRFHAQPNACPVCGPRAQLLDRDGEPLDLPGGGDAVHASARLLAGGAVLAVKGIGGYHLACAAADEDAVRALRARKRREDRPFALMARDAAVAGALARLGETELAMLVSARGRSCSRRAAPAGRSPKRRPGCARARPDAPVCAAPPPAAR